MEKPLLVTIHRGYLPGTIGRIVELHGHYYHRHWRFGRFFESKVATELSAFIERYDQQKDGIWLALVQGRVEGSIVIDGTSAHTQGAHLRWFILSEELQCQGVGRKLMNRAMAFCSLRAYHNVFLWTFEGLGAARHLYETFGFKLAQQQTGDQWGTRVKEQRFEFSAMQSDEEYPGRHSGRSDS